MITLDEFESVYAGADPWLSFLWKIVEMPQIGGMSLPPALIEGVTLPIPAFVERAKNIASTEMFYAGGTSPGQFSMICGLDQKLRAMRYFDYWSQLIQNPYTGGFRLPSQYKKDVHAELYNNQGEVVCTCIVRNTWPQAVDGLNTGTDSTSPQLNVAFKSDAFLFKWS